MIQRKRKAIFKVGNNILGCSDVTNDTIQEIENLKLFLANDRNISTDDIDVELKEEYIEISDLFITSSGKLCFWNSDWNVEQVNGFSFLPWIDVSTETGIDTIGDYISQKRIEELIKFN